MLTRAVAAPDAQENLWLRLVLTSAVAVAGAQENLWLWMTDKRGRDQFVIRYGDETEVFWNDAARTQAGSRSGAPADACCHLM